MKRFKALLVLLLAFAMTMPSFSPMAVEAAATSDIELTSKRIVLEVSDQFKIKTVGYYKSVTWKSSKPSVATIDADGIITAKKAGKTNITTRIDGVEYKCKVVVKDKVIGSPETSSSSENGNVSSNWEDYEFSVNGKTLSLPCTIQDIESVGLYTKSNKLEGDLPDKKYTFMQFYPDIKTYNYAIYAEASNLSGKSKPISNCPITSYSLLILIASK